jgi:hypothetical protein
MAFITYSGMSQYHTYIIPSAISNPPNDNFECRFCAIYAHVVQKKLVKFTLLNKVEA